jgi:hypothetical protein
MLTGFGKRSMDDVEIVSINRDLRMIVIRKRPRSMQQVLDALCEYWRENEMPWSITEVMRYAPPQKIFYQVEWLTDE